MPTEKHLRFFDATPGTFWDANGNEVVIDSDGRPFSQVDKMMSQSTQTYYTFRDLLLKNGINPATTLLMRHRPMQPALAKAIAWLAHEHIEAFNAYQSTHYPRQVAQLMKAKTLAAFIASGVGKATFAGIFDVCGWIDRTASDQLLDPGVQKLLEFDLPKPTGTAKWFNLSLSPKLREYQGRLEIDWSGGASGGKAWSRWATSVPGKNFPVAAVHTASQFADAKAMPDWNELVLTWAELNVIPKAWARKLKEWRCIYFILDTSDSKGYVGAAYGEDNLYGRWINYASSGDGGNELLKLRTPTNLRFSILQRLSPDLDEKGVRQIESSWKKRLGTKSFGLNAN